MFYWIRLCDAAGNFPKKKIGRPRFDKDPEPAIRESGGIWGGAATPPKSSPDSPGSLTKVETKPSQGGFGGIRSSTRALGKMEALSKLAVTDQECYVDLHGTSEF